MTNTKKISLIVLSCLLVVSLCLSFGLSTQTSAKAEEIAVENYFSSQENITVTANAEDTRGNKGVSVQLTGVADKTKASFEYKNYIDVASLANGFLEMSFMPSQIGAHSTDNDFTIVTLTDSLDETQKLVYIITSQPQSSGWWSPYITSLVSFVDDLTWATSSTYNSAPIIKIVGTSQTAHSINDVVNTAHPSWYGEYMDSGNSLGNKSDYTVKSTASSQLNSFVFALKDTLVYINDNLIADINNKDFLYYSSRYLVGSQYEGLYTEERVANLFSSGFCKLKIEYQGINSDSITCHFKNIGGQNFASNQGCSVESRSPLISANICENGVLGEKYAIPQPYVHDMIDGDLSDRAIVKVFDESGKSVHSGYEGYAFESVEKHTIRYTVTNSRGATFSKDFVIKVYEESPLTSFGFNVEYQEVYTVGDTIAIPATVVENSIAIDLAVDADVIIQKDGRVIDVFTNEEGKSYTLSSPGKYSLVFRYTNTYGVSNSQVRNFTVLAGIQYDNEVPVSLYAGRENILKDFSITNNYNDVDEQKVYRAIFVNGANVYTAQGDKVISGSLTLPASTFSANGTATVEYKVAFEKDNFLLAQSHSVPVITPKYMGDYLVTYNAQGVFTSDDVTITNQKLNTVYETVADGGFMLPQAISQDLLSAVFNVRAGKTDFEKLNVIFENVANRNQKITFSLVKDNDMQSQLTVQGVKVVVSGSLLNPVNKFDWVWDDQRAMLCDAAGNAITGAISTWDNGEKFSGFERGAIVRFEFAGVGSGGAGLEIERISNQPFTSTVLSSGKVQPVQDAFAPYIELHGSYANVSFEYGDILTVYRANEFDVLDANTALYVTLTAPDGTVILDKVACDQEYTVTISQYGRWSLIYTAHDSTDLTQATSRFNFNVVDTKNPTITITNQPKDLYAVGQTISFDGVHVFDNITQECTLHIFVVEPDGERELVDGSYTFNQVGVYKIIYCAQDEAGNISMITFNVKVSGGLK